MTKFFHPILAIYFFFVPFAFAATPEQMETPKPVYDYYNTPPLNTNKFYGDFIYTMFVLGCVVTAMLLASWFIRRMMQTKVQQRNMTSSIKIMETRVLGHKSLLHLIDVEGTTLLISETPTGVTPLLKLKGDRSFDQLMEEKNSE